MVTREGSSSRAIWKMRSSSSVKRSVVAHATTSTDIEVGEEFQQIGIFADHFVSTILQHKGPCLCRFLQ